MGELHPPVTNSDAASNITNRLQISYMMPALCCSHLARNDRPGFIVSLNLVQKKQTISQAGSAN
jgi:hypothetical protein